MAATKKTKEAEAADKSPLLPEELRYPHGWSKYFLLDPLKYGREISRTTRSLGTNAKGCIVEAVDRVACIDTDQESQPTTFVVIVQQVPAGGGGLGINVLGSGGSLNKANFNWIVVKYSIGIQWTYEFRITTTITTERCPGPPPAVYTSISASDQPGWVLVNENADAILKQEVIAGPFPYETDAKTVADSQAPAGSGIMRSYPAIPALKDP